jgi:predicted NUDIX family NTP pyrophosphohydrolase
MITDIELLELAAKAAGIDVKWVRNSGCFYYDRNETGHEIFDPLTDDGDALRLAVKLRLRFKFSDEWAVCEEGTYKKYGSIRAEELNIQDPYAATRRAIVRAAAEIGKGM